MGACYGRTGGRKMTPDPTVVGPDPDTGLGPIKLDSDARDAPYSVEDQANWGDKAASVAFGGQSSDDAAEPPTDNGSLFTLLAFVGVILAIGFLRSWWFPGILAGLIVMLFLHEFGHYITARASGMKVTEFFIGFGPKIWSFNRGETCLLYTSPSPRDS